MVSKWHHCYKSCPNQQSVQSGGGKTIENIRLIGGFYFSLSILKIWKSFWIPDQSSCGLSCRIPFPIFSYRTSILLGLLGVFLWLDQSRFRHRGHKEDISRSPCSCQTLLALGKHCWFQGRGTQNSWRPRKRVCTSSWPQEPSITQFICRFSRKSSSSNNQQ